MKKAEILTRWMALLIIAIIFIIAIAAMFVVAPFGSFWWLLIPLDIVITYFFTQEFFPDLNIKQVKKIMGDKVIETKKEHIPVSRFFLRKIARHNRRLEKENKNFQFFLTTCPKLANQFQGSENIKITGKNCFFLLKEYHLESAAKLIPDRPEVYKLGEGEGKEKIMEIMEMN